jgi:ABC-type dipeptide/oligopeptide/nickel transport system ATPase component
MYWMTTSTPHLSQPLLSAQITVRYPGKAPVLRGVSLEIARGEIFQGADLLAMRERELRNLRGRSLSLVLQSPLASLNPALQIRTQLREAWRAHCDDKATNEDCDRAIQSALKSVSLPSGGLDRDFLNKHASQLSVGQAQRVLIAMAVMHRPALLIADESTSALDVITQSEILELFARLNREIGMSILYISHDLPSVAGICQRIAILHEGQIVECGPTEQIFTAPVHAYTRRLMDALPQLPKRREAAMAKAQAATMD